MYLGYVQNTVDHFGNIDQLVAVNRLIESFFLSRFPQDAERIHYVERGVAPPVVPREPSDGTFRIGLIGRIEQSSKRVFDLIQLCSILRGCELPLEIHVYGNGPDDEELRRRIVEVRSDLRVIYHGFVSGEDLYRRAYPTLDAMLLFSPTEGSPTVLYEAMRHGVVPIISRYLGHACDGIVQHGINGFTFSVGAVNIAADQILTLAGNVDLFSRLSLRATCDVTSCLEEKMHADWERILQDSLELEPRRQTQPFQARVSVHKEGRLNNLIPSATLVDWFRRMGGRQFPHQAGFEEWPGSQPVSAFALDELNASLHAIENAAARQIYGCENDLDVLEKFHTSISEVSR
jgi:glycosyltransferase involved in cell wall biosynthesis